MLNLAGTTSIYQLNTILASDTVTPNGTFYATSTFVSAVEPMNRATSDALFEYFYGPGAETDIGWFMIFDLYGGGGSAVTSKDADYNAFDARDALYSIRYYGTIPDTVSDEDGIAFTQGMKKAVEDTSPRRSSRSTVSPRSFQDSSLICYQY